MRLEAFVHWLLVSVLPLSLTFWFGATFGRRRCVRYVDRCKRCSPPHCPHVWVEGLQTDEPEIKGWAIDIRKCFACGRVEKSQLGRRPVSGPRPRGEWMEAEQFDRARVALAAQVKFTQLAPEGLCP